MNRYIYDKNNTLRGEIPNSVLNKLVAHRAGEWERYKRKDGATGIRYVIYLTLDLDVNLVKLYLHAGDYIV